MKPIIRILQKVLVNHFYAANTGFFLFIFFVFFGLPYQPVTFHRSMIQGIIESPLFLGLVMVTWMLYTFKCMDYTVKQIVHPRQLFLFSLNSLNRFEKWLYMVFVQFMIFLPVLLYAAFMIVMAVQQGRYIVVAEIVAFLVLITAVVALVYVQWLQRTHTSPLPSKRIFRIKMVLKKPMWSWPLYQVWSSKKQMLLITKFFTIAFLFAFIRLYEPERQDLRPLQLCILLIAAANSAIVFQVHRFQNALLPFTKNLPISTSKRFVYILGAYVLLALPELLFLFKGYGLHFNLVDYPQLFLLLTGLLTLFHACLVMASTTMDQFVRTVFGIMAALYFIIMYNPGTALPALVLLLSFCFFVSYFNVSEVSDQNA